MMVVSRTGSLPALWLMRALAWQWLRQWCPRRLPHWEAHRVPAQLIV
jgi:hypothetical protein